MERPFAKNHRMIRILTQPCVITELIQKEGAPPVGSSGKPELQGFGNVFGKILYRAREIAHASGNLQVSLTSVPGVLILLNSENIP